MRTLTLCEAFQPQTWGQLLGWEVFFLKNFALEWSLLNRHYFTRVSYQAKAELTNHSKSSESFSSASKNAAFATAGRL